MNRSLRWKRAIGKGYSLLVSEPSSAHPQAVVLTYHSVGNSALAVPEETFRQQMFWLSTYTAVLDLDSIMNGDWIPSPSGLVCAITFDDGYASVHRSAYPILQKFQLPATVYLVANAIGDSNRKSSNDFKGLYPNEEMLTWSEVKEMHAHQIQFGSHLLDHHDLTSLSPARAEAELRGSKQQIEDRLGAPCTSFCYPWGRHNRKTIDAVCRSGYENAVITIQGRWKRSLPPNRYAIPRADIRREYSVDDFSAVVRGKWDFLGYIQRFRQRSY